MTTFQRLVLGLSRKKMARSLRRNFKLYFGDFKREKPQNPIMLYAHIPFCHTFCPYCSFHKFLYDENLARDYFAALRKELQSVKERGFDFHTLIVGGGTTLIHESELLRTLELAKKLFNIDEISCESDPNHIEPRNLGRFKGLITRLSCGVQSFDDEILRKIVRFEKFGSGEMLRDKLSQAIGVLPIFSVDLIFNFPGQSKEQLLSDLECAKSLNPQQITTYPLMSSKLNEARIRGAFGGFWQDNEYEFYREICKFFESYYQNNAWSFAPQKSVLNDEYVSHNPEYLGVGSGAFSFLGGEVLINAFNLSDYAKMINEKGEANIAKMGFERSEILRYMFLTTLFSGSLNLREFNENFDCDLQKELKFELFGLKAANAIKQSGEMLICTDFGRYLCVVLMKDFYSGMDLVRAVFRDDARIKNRDFVEIYSVM